LRGAYLEDLRHTAGHSSSPALEIDYLELRLSEPPTFELRRGRIFERLTGEWVPRRLRFSGLIEVQLDGLYNNLAAVPDDHPARSLRGALHWRMKETGKPLFILQNGSDDPARLWVCARHLTQEDRPTAPLPLKTPLLRPWSPAPLLPVGNVPDPQTLRSRFGGDPVGIFLNGEMLHNRLFIGDLGMQTAQRPAVGVVLNVGEEPNPWAPDGLMPAADRWTVRGEGTSGMDRRTILREARWVMERLRAGHSVLVHCLAGMNRSATICCAVLILLEGLSAEDALQRVRVRHPWARPDSYHWLRLRWLSANRTSTS
jgi:hypothetical protein